jgi:predicted RNase H-like HicB family nuclease
MTRCTAPLAWPVRLDAAKEGGFIVTFPDFGVGVTQGDDREEALARGADLLLRALLSHPKLREPRALEYLGVDHVRVTRRISLGRLRNFTYAEPLEAR